jgi:hypothetical protein
MFMSMVRCCKQHAPVVGMLQAAYQHVALKSCKSSIISAAQQWQP